MSTSGDNNTAGSLPIDEVLPELLMTLETASSAVLVAAPGAGKTTRVPPALLASGWLGANRILVLEPRRLAARSAAIHVASLLGEPVGKTIGYRVRHETRVSKETRIEFITSGIFTRMIVDDPELSGVGAVLFDEFHERSLDNDLGLALALDSQKALRPDLRLLPMSATLDGARVAALLDNAPVIESEGRSYKVEIAYRPRRADEPLDQAMASAIRQALREDNGSVLCFLPGQADIHRVHDRLKQSSGLPQNTDIHLLYGALEPKDQFAAIAPSGNGHRKIVLATSIAETSLTIEGVTTVIDSGLARVSRYDPAAGVSRLETVRASLASVTQRAGRAGRTTPGRAIRLWHEGQAASLAEFERPEILESDLSGLVLDLADWGVTDPLALKWIDPPPAAIWEASSAALQQLGALDEAGVITPKGRALRALPVGPRLAAMMLAVARSPLKQQAALAALLIEDQGMGGRSVDLEARLDRFRNDKGPRAVRIRAMADRLAEQAAAYRGKQEIELPPETTLGGLASLAFPDRIAANMGQAADGSASFRLANGRRARLDATEILSSGKYIVVADLQGTAATARILLAASISLAEIRALHGARIEERREVRLDRATGAFRARVVERLGSLELSARSVPLEAGDRLEEAVANLIRDEGLFSVLPVMVEEPVSGLLARLAFAHLHLPDTFPPVDESSLQECMDGWLLPMLSGVRSLSAVDAGKITDGLYLHAGHEAMSLLSEIAPADWPLPTGRRQRLEYAAGGKVVLRARVQEFYGLTRHPAITSRLLPAPLPVTLELLSPAMRPVQTTTDLPGFWSGSWQDVRKDMRGRYPKHVWPDDPATAQATSRAKPR
ncbi:MAG: ATP-dependent helicase HrpB [Phyllobacteriaceae bacterium]|nr:ATP-dependent helicase HrpB [Phyllobacteriaceae bacterium]